MLLLFVLSARFAYRTGGRQRLIELLSAIPFGLLLEQGDIKIFGSYAYNQGFFIKLGSVPVAIALAWAMIITSSMFMSDRLRIRPGLAPFADAARTLERLAPRRRVMLSNGTLAMLDRGPGYERMVRGAKA